MKAKQFTFFKKDEAAYGGDLLKRRKGRLRGRPLDTKNTMHLVLRSSLAKGDWSFRKHQKKIGALVEKFTKRFGVRVISLANVGNHLHFHLKLSNRYTYRPFIRGLTAAIAMAVTGRNRWTIKDGDKALKFWDYRPFTRVVVSFRAFLNLRDYIRINQWEGLGRARSNAIYLVKNGIFPNAAGNSG